MKLIALILIGLVAVEHIYILWIEMFAWTTKGRTTFKSFPAELFEPTRTLAANQGLYNGFLAAGLLWGLFSGRRDLKVFFLCCVIVAGVYGGLTAKMSILYVQGVPALAALLAVLSTRPPRTRSRL